MKCSQSGRKSFSQKAYSSPSRLDSTSGTLPNQDDFLSILENFDMQPDPSTNGYISSGDVEVQAAVMGEEDVGNDKFSPEMSSLTCDLDPVSEYSLSVASESPAALQPPAFISTDSGVSLGSTSTTTLVLSHPSESREESQPKKRGKGGKRRRHAEEKAAQVRARNRRAQQAFRKRQKVLSAERTESLAKLEDTVAHLKNVNKSLTCHVAELQKQLETERSLRAEAMVPQLARLSQCITQPLESVFEHDTTPEFSIPANFIF